MVRWLIPALAALAVLAIGIGVGATVFGGNDSPTTSAPAQDDAEPTTSEVDDEVQETCLAALDAVEQEVQVEERTSTLLDEYESVIERATEALADFDTRRLEQLLSDVETLNRRSDRLIDETRNTDLDPAIETCRSLLGTNEV